jgi:hypothetical protein
MFRVAATGTTADLIRYVKDRNLANWPASPHDGPKTRTNKAGAITARTTMGPTATRKTLLKVLKKSF